MPRAYAAGGRPVKFRKRACEVDAFQWMGVTNLDPSHPIWFNEAICVGQVFFESVGTPFCSAHFRSSLTTAKPLDFIIKDGRGAPLRLSPNNVSRTLRGDFMTKELTTAACADLLYRTREKRYVLQHQVDDLQAEETALKTRLISELQAINAEGITGKVCRVEIKLRPVYMVRDWDLFYKHIVKTKNFELLQKRLSTTAIKERWDAGKTVPGVAQEDMAELSIHKV